MHAYILIGGSKEEISQKAKSLSSGKIIPFEVKKIDQARQLKKLTSVTLDTTTILITGLDEASIDAQNAILKTLEEPGSEIVYMLWVSRIARLLPTVISRCQIVKLSDPHRTGNTLKIDAFLIGGLGKRFIEIENYKKREDAIDFVCDLIIVLREKMYGSTDKAVWAAKLKSANDTYQYLHLNANVMLALSALCINL